MTSSPVKRSYVVTSGFSFNGAPLWSDLNQASTDGGIKHHVTLKKNNNTRFMIYFSPQDKYDNAGKGIKFE